jgi:hypothetical protein
VLRWPGPHSTSFVPSPTLAPCRHLIGALAQKPCPSTRRASRIGDAGLVVKLVVPVNATPPFRLRFVPVVGAPERLLATAISLETNHHSCDSPSPSLFPLRPL